jgi:hypothetical protein
MGGVSDPYFDEPAFLFQLLLEFAKAIFPACGRHHASAFPSEENSGLASDSAGRTNNQNNVIF